jgi:uncharacterized protein (TIGR01619 family)
MALLTTSYHVSSEMTDNWKPYLCNVNSKLASILVNLELRQSVPIESKPWLLWVWVYFQSSRADGLSDSEEAPTLYKIEDALTPALAGDCRAILSGRITTDGRREFYFYGETRDGFRNAVEHVMKDFAGYKFDIGEQEDSSWNQYLNVLYPSPENLERISNMDLLDRLVEKGDVLTLPREVHHWVYFGSESSRSLFRDSVLTEGFRVESEFNGTTPLPFGISIARTQSIEQRIIDETVTYLFRLAKSFGGEYTGWETPVVTQ